MAGDGLVERRGWRSFRDGDTKNGDWGMVYGFTHINMFKQVGSLYRGNLRENGDLSGKIWGVRTANNGGWW
jgi:hypothetical protein